MAVNCSLFVLELGHGKIPKQNINLMGQEMGHFGRNIKFHNIYDLRKLILKQELENELRI